MGIVGFDDQNSKKGSNFILQFGLIVFTFIILLYHFMFETSYGQKTTWGLGATYLDIGVPLTSINLFYIFLLGSLICFLIGIFLNRITGEGRIFGINGKQFAFVGLLLYFLGILAYFEFRLFEPFILAYLIIIALLYLFFITNPSSPAYEATYTGFKSMYSDFTPWPTATKNYLRFVFTNQPYDYYLILLILMLFVFVFFYTKVQGSLLSEETVQKLQILNLKKFVFDSQNSKHLMGLIIFLIVQQYGLLISFLRNPYLSIFYLVLTIGFPLFFADYLRFPLTPLIKTKIRLNVMDVYLLNLLIISVLFTLLGNFNFNFGLYMIVFMIVLILLKHRPKQVLEKAEKTTVNITITALFNYLLFYMFAFYIASWFNGNQFEGIFINLLYYLILIRLSPIIIRSIMSPGIIKFSIRRVLLIIPMFVGVSIITYGLIALTGNPIDIILQGACRNTTNPNCKAQYRAVLESRFGLNATVPVQWFHWFMHFLLGDAGQSLFFSPSVTQSLLARVIPTLEISLIPTILSLFIAIPLGIVAANHQYSIWDEFILIFVAFGVAVPIFVFLIILILFFTGYLEILPNVNRTLAGGIDRARDPSFSLQYAHWYFNGIPLDFKVSFQNITVFHVDLGSIRISDIVAWVKWDWLFHALIPIFAITILGLAFYTRLVRGGMLEVMRQDFILSARASGFSENVIIRKYAMRNVLVPVVTFFGISLGSVLAGAPITETVMAWPGLGLYALQGILFSDYAIIMATNMIIALMILFANLFTDILYSIIDPRIRIE